MRKCNYCGAENPETDGRCCACGASLNTNEKPPALLGSMGGKKYGSLELSPKEQILQENRPAACKDTGLLGSMGNVVYENTGKRPAPADSSADGKTGGAQSVAPKETGLAGSMGGVRYGIKPVPPSRDEPEKEEKRKTDKALIVTTVVSVLTLAATVLLVFWNTLSGSAELYGRGLGGFINYYKPVEEEDVLEEDGVSYVGDQMVIVSGLNIPYEEMEQYFSSHDMKIVGYVELIDTYQVQLDRSYTLAELHSMAKELEKDPEVDSATVNAVRENTAFLVPSDPWDGDCNWNTPTYYTGNWGVMAIRAPQSWERWEPQVVRAGLIDSMFDENHPDLYFETTRDNDIFPYVSDPDAKSHGTHVSGTIGAIHNNGVGVAGVAENCVLYAYSAYRYEGSIDEASAIAELAAQNVRVINYSMGLVPEIRDEAIAHNGMERDIYYHFASEFSQEALRHLLLKGYDFVLVCSAGNDPVGAEWASEYAYITDPEIRARILVVGAAGINYDGSYYQVSWSARGDRVDVLAPGVDIYSTVPGGGGYMSGTSMAAPHVTGVCASVWAIAPELSGADVKRIVVETADIRVPGGSANMVNMYAAMAAAEAARP